VTVEVLYVDDCPNWRECGERTAAALKAAGLDGVAVNYRRIATSAEAAALPFAGSPTILINGADAFDNAERITELACRLFETDARVAPLPTVEQLTQAFRRPFSAVPGITPPAA